MLFDSRKHTMLRFPTIILWGTSAVFTRNLRTNISAYPDYQHCDCADQVH